eukprot:CAMPEP_0198238756 /NCGR_PEP_ID=MMETSP1446-20131203/4330_1 /TAXON_ID=1461542 ORGANISM="Unidentified sp, Strain CCMP2111" /NCGR_SAMPLE_ID=MMETSP1446 /ASSEMBLY_ACC=CAM_ASM_001112 /LENGTH=162 /DNA_ID=CAMNT_0043921223 /DNA_START=580 /DNA_END=1071 /DNA_ORIENTATION=+
MSVLLLVIGKRGKSGYTSDQFFQLVVGILAAAASSLWTCAEAARLLCSCTTLPRFMATPWATKVEVWSDLVISLLCFGSSCSFASASAKYCYHFGSYQACRLVVGSNTSMWLVTMLMSIATVPRIAKAFSEAANQLEPGQSMLQCALGQVTSPSSSVFSPAF